MKNFVHDGRSLTVAAPYAVSSGDGVKVGNEFGIAANDQILADNMEIRVQGVFDLKKDTSTFVDGDIVYWDDSAKKATSTSANNIAIGVAELLSPDGTSALGGSSGDATVRVRLNGAFPSAQGQIDSSLIQTKTVSLAAADIIAMNGAPVAILAAPGANKYYVVSEFTFEMTRTSTAFTAGGAVSLQYHTTTTSVPHAGSVAATVVTTGGPGTAVVSCGPNVGTNGLVVPVNEGVDITNATAAFATGTGTAKVKIKYRIITLG